MFEVQNSIDWKTAKSHYIKAGHDIYYDNDDYSRILVFKSCDAGLSSQLDELFGGDWQWLGANDIEMLEEHYKALNRIEILNKVMLDNVKLEYGPEAVSFESLAQSKALDHLKVRFTNWDHPTVKGDDAIVRLFPERLMMFLSEFSDLLNAKNRAYGNSALEPIKVFSKASSSDVILQQIDHKLSRLKNSDTPTKNDVIDLMGYLTLYCLDQSWLDLQDLHK